MSPTLQGLNIQTPDPQDELVKESGAEDPTELIRTLPDDAVVIISVRNMVLFPGMIAPIFIGRKSPIGIVMQLDAEMEAPDLAAMAAGVKKVMLPARNRRDLDDVPARAQLEFLFLSDVEEAIPIAI